MVFPYQLDSTLQIDIDKTLGLILLLNGVLFIQIRLVVVLRKNLCLGTCNCMVFITFGCVLLIGFCLLKSKWGLD